MKSWIRRFALLAVMGSLVGGIVMAGCTPSEPPADENTATDGTTPAPEDGAPAPEDAPPAPEDAPPAP